MLMRLLKADLARGAVVAATLTALITLAAMLMSAGTSLVVDSVAATNRLSERSNLPDLVQMHTGDAATPRRSTPGPPPATTSPLTRSSRPCRCPARS